MIAKAVGLKGQSNPSVLDCTAGWESMPLSWQLWVVRSPCLREIQSYMPLEDALERACSAEDLEVSSAVRRMQLLKPMDTAYLQNDKGVEKASVIYLDPMFPPRESRRSQKSMQAFHALSGMIIHFLALCRRNSGRHGRVSPLLNDQSVSHTLEGQRNRYDIYLKAGSASAG